jgi:hypothetical protein
LSIQILCFAGILLSIQILCFAGILLSIQILCFAGIFVYTDFVSRWYLLSTDFVFRWYSFVYTDSHFIVLLLPIRLYLKH